MGDNLVDNSVMDFARLLRLAVAYEGVRCMDLAVQVGISRAQMSRIMTGKCDPLFSTVQKLEKALPKLRELRDQDLRKAAA